MCVYMRVLERERGEGRGERGSRERGRNVEKDHIVALTYFFSWFLCYVVHSTALCAFEEYIDTLKKISLLFLLLLLSSYKLYLPPLGLNQHHQLSPSGNPFRNFSLTQPYLLLSANISIC